MNATVEQALMSKIRTLSPQQLAEVRGVAQQTVQAYEAGSRRIPVSAVAELPKSQQQFVSRMLETVLAQAAAR